MSLVRTLMFSAAAAVATAQNSSVAVSIFDSSDCSGPVIGGDPVTAPSGSCRTVPGISGISFQGTCEGTSGGGTIKACRSTDCTGTCSPATSFSSNQCFKNLPGFSSNSVSVRCTTSSGNNPDTPNGVKEGVNPVAITVVAGVIVGAIAILRQ